MELTLKNIGKVSEATIAIDGITVIAGENNTGKSTASKVLFSIFNGFYDVENQVKKARIKSLAVAVERMLFERPFPTTQRHPSDTIAVYIIDNVANLKGGGDDVHSLVASAIKRYNEKFNRRIDVENIPESLINRITEIFSVDDRKILDNLFRDRLEAEFNGQVNNIYTEEVGEIILTIKNLEVSIEIRNNEICGVSRTLDLSTESIYIDDPFVVDEVRSMPPRLRMRQQYGHRNHLKNILSNGKRDLVVDEIITTKKFDAIFDKTDFNLEASIVGSRRPDFESGKNNGDKPRVATKNLSTGLKTFWILKTLLTNGTIQPNGTIILDEPEIHLHPEWQLLFAELIVLIQKEFNMHVLLNTHSPYFLRAIEVYSAKHEIANRCNYYLAETSDGLATFKNVNDNIDAIYKKLSKPFQDLENERFRND